MGVQELERLRVLNQVRREVADADVRTHARFRQITRTEAAVRVGRKAFEEDFIRIRGHQGRPIELLESFAGRGPLFLSRRHRRLQRAQIDLYVALGKPPADTLAKPVPTNSRSPCQRRRRKDDRVTG